jgi:signal transduction histidine kinase
LVTNAAAAMDGEGELAIVLENDPHGPGDTATRQPARFGRLRVVDTGHGMDKLTLDRAFEPFFTTKPIGQGTGLGLPVVYGMIRELGGTIALASEPGRGTTATIWIPADNGELGDGIDTGG